MIQKNDWNLDSQISAAAQAIESGRPDKETIEVIISELLEQARRNFPNTEFDKRFPDLDPMLRL